MGVGGRERALCKRRAGGAGRAREFILCGRELGVLAFLGGGERCIQESTCHRVLAFPGVCASMNTFKYSLLAPFFLYI